MARAPRKSDAAPAPAGLPADAASPGAPPDVPVLRTYPVLSPLKHGGRLYLPGEDHEDHLTVITLPEGEAEALQAIGVLGEPL